ncbi:hypothetical protein lerEdw1_005718 [Lerista edwardsae]|nr:hypothetical protein lerEdw1_005719 [Lerista edwardsae]KAJ6650612.1 hypothetical protein lerEdw1_005718 [Lerista edwardsae]
MCRSHRAPCAAAAAAFVLLLLLTGRALQSEAAPLTGELRCQCIQTVSEAILHRHIASVLLLPEGPHCEVSEVM